MNETTITYYYNIIHQARAKNILASERYRVLSTMPAL